MQDGLSQSSAQDIIISLYEDRAGEDGTLWLGNHKGLVALSPDGSFQRFMPPESVVVNELIRWYDSMLFLITDYKYIYNFSTVNLEFNPYRKLYKELGRFVDPKGRRSSLCRQIEWPQPCRSQNPRKFQNCLITELSDSLNWIRSSKYDKSERSKSILTYFVCR